MKLAIKMQLTWPNAWEQVQVPAWIGSDWMEWGLDGDWIGMEWIGTGTEGVCKRVPHN